MNQQYFLHGAKIKKKKSVKKIEGNFKNSIKTHCLQ